MSRQRNRLLSALLLFSIIGMHFLASAAEQKADIKTQKTDLNDFSYTSQDRRDPFEPLYLMKKKKERKASDVRKTGYELEELKLVGVLKTGNVKFAMMEDIQGRGLLFKKGDFLNKNLWVLDIMEDKMLLGYKLKGDVRKLAIDIPRK